MIKARRSEGFRLLAFRLHKSSKSEIISKFSVEQYLSLPSDLFVVKTSCSPSVFAVPGVEGQQFGVHQYESVLHLLACSVHVAVDLLHQPTLQKLDALLTKGRVDQPFHRLNRDRELFMCDLKLNLAYD